MKKGILVLAIIALAVSMVGLDGARVESAEPIVIGAPIPRASTYGQNGERSMILAAEQINAGGGIKVGGQMRPIKLEIADTRDEEPGVPTSEVLLAIEKLILDKNTKILAGGPCMSECSLAALDVYPKYKTLDIVNIGTWTPAWHKKTAGNPETYKYSFRLSGHVVYWVKDLVRLLNNLKATYGFNKMYITVAEAAHAKASAAAVKKGAVASGWTVVGEEVHPLATTDFFMMLRDVKKSGAQVLFIWDHTPEALGMIKQWHDLKIPAAAIGFVGPTDDPGMWKQTGGKVSHLVEVGGEGGTLPGQQITPLTEPFFEAYKKRWGVEPRGAANAPSYTVLYMLKEAIERTGSLDPDTLIPAVEQTDMITVSGRLRFDKQSHQAIYGTNPKETLVGQYLQWQDGKRVTIWPAEIASGKYQLPPWMK
ncbi:MAG: ABC transporter substrate-binding protein [Deltaproteobacteria bacterium]|nr:MAG: ABC transporter substrate-binding protein [Deltaproteobacteria bacterium]